MPFQLSSLLFFIYQGGQQIEVFFPELTQSNFLAKLS